jgi:RND family efflux transporter MFP subunit
MNIENPAPEIKSNEVSPATAVAPDTFGDTKGNASPGRRKIVVGGLALAIAAGLAAGIVPRLRARGKLAVAVHETALPTVSVTNATRLGRDLKLTLPGDVYAFEETEIYSRADGYLLKWHTDIGAKVEAGQALAEIDTPELDEELNQSRAALAQAQANLGLARTSAARWVELLKDRAVSQQEVDEKNGALAAREADVKAAEAAAQRLEKLTNFKQIRAPFAGTITGRFVDAGALIHAGGAGNASPLFKLAQTGTLRVHVNVPQAYLRDISLGQEVETRVAEYPGREFAGKIVRTSGAFNPATRTLLTEIEVPNSDGALYPGIHVDADLSLSRGNPPLVLPAGAVIVRGNGVQVATVDDTGSIRLRMLQLGRDLGQTVEVVSGVDEGARVVTNPTDTLFDGARVQLAGSQPSTAGGTQVARR